MTLVVAEDEEKAGVELIAVLEFADVKEGVNVVTPGVVGVVVEAKSKLIRPAEVDVWYWSVPG
jgi:hypothetical protein